MKRVSPFILIPIIFLLTPFRSLGVEEFNTIQELLDKNYSNPTDVLIKNLTVIDHFQNYNNRYILMDNTGNAICLINTSSIDLSVGDSFSSISCNFQTNYSNSTLGWLYLNDEGQTIKGQSNQIYPQTKILTGSINDNPSNNEYVRVEATMTDISYVVTNGSLPAGYNITPISSETEYIIFNPEIRGFNLKSNKKYVFFGLVDNTIRNALNTTPKTQRNIIFLSNAYEVTDDGVNAPERRIGVYTENDDWGNCSIGGGNSSPDGDGIIWNTVKDGSTVMLHAVANTGYEFKCWTFNGKEVSTDADYEVTVYGDALYCAVFEQSKIVENTITITVPEGAKIILNNKSYRGSQDVMLVEGTSATIEAVAPEGYVFDHWENGSGQNVSSNNPYSFTVEGDITLIPVFKEEVKYVSITVQSSDPSQGKVLINSSVETSRKFILGEEVKIEGVPGNGYRFKYWDLGDGLTTEENPYSFQAEKDLTATAYFAAAEWTVTFKAGGNGSMKVTNSSGKELKSGDKVENGTEITVMLTPDSRYKVDELLVKRGNGEETSVPVANDKYTTVINSDTEIKATFKVDINGYYDLKVSVEEHTGGEVLGEAYIDEPGLTSMSAKYMEDHTFYAVPNSFSKFVGWRNADSDNIRSAGTFKDGAYLLEWNGASDENLVAVFDYKMVFPRTVTVRANNPDKGMVAIIGEKELTVESRKPVTVKATPLTDYDLFRDWTTADGEVISTEPEFTYEDEEDIELTANFYSLYPVTLENEGLSQTKLVDENGNEITSGKQLPDGTVITVVGVAHDSEVLKELTVNNEPLAVETTTDGFEATVILDRPKAIKAVWEIKLYSVSIEYGDGGEVHIYSDVTPDGKPSGNRLTDGQKVSHGTTIHIFALPYDGYQIESLTLNEQDITSTLEDGYISFVVKENIQLQTQFYKEYYNLKVSIEEVYDGEILGSVYIDEPGTTALVAKYMEDHTFYAVPNSFSKFVGWRKADSDNIRSTGTFKDGAYVLEWNGASDENLVAVFDYKMVFPRTVTVKANNPDKGMVAIVGEKELTVESRKPVTVKATPLSEYDFFKFWTTPDGTVISKEPEFTYEDEEDIELTANFYSLYPVTVENEGLSQTKLLDESGNEITSGSILPEEAIIKIIGLNHESERLKELIINGENISVDTKEDGFEITFILKKPLSIQVIWEKKQYSLTINYTEGGEICIYSDINETGQPSGNQITSNNKLIHGETIHIFCLPQERYQLENLTINGIEMSDKIMDNYLSYTVTCDLSISAIFNPRLPEYYDLKVSVEEHTGGEVLGEAYIDEPGTTSMSAKYMEDHTFYAVPNSFSKFVGWRNADSDNIRSAGTFKDGAYVLEWNGACDENLVAVFDYKMVFPRTVTVKANNPDKGMVTIVGEKELTVESRKPVTVKATPLTDYDLFRDWTTADGTVISTEPEFTYEDEEDIELIANFYSLYPVTLENEGLGQTKLVDENGNEITSGKQLPDGTVITIVGIAHDSEVLKELTVNNEPLAVETTADGFEATVILDRPMAIKAIWEIKLYSVSIEYGDGGEVHIYSDVTPDGKPSGNRMKDGQKVSHGTTIHIFALPYDGYQIESLTLNGQDITSTLENGHLEHSALNHVAVAGKFKATPSAIESPHSDKQKNPTIIYDLQGRQVNGSLESLRPGIYIIREGDSVKKVRID